MIKDKDAEPQNKTVLFLIGGIVLLFLVLVLLPQSFWVNLSIKLFP